jgi:hypothetical protein
LQPLSSQANPACSGAPGCGRTAAPAPPSRGSPAYCAGCSGAAPTPGTHPRGRDRRLSGHSHPPFNRCD